MESSPYAKLSLSSLYLSIKEHLSVKEVWRKVENQTRQREHFPKYEITKLPTMHTKEAAESG